MRINENNRRKVGSLQEYPSSYIWAVYEHRCPQCGAWHDGSDTTESYLCKKCAEEITL